MTSGTDAKYSNIAGGKKENGISNIDENKNIVNIGIKSILSNIPSRFSSLKLIAIMGKVTICTKRVINGKYMQNEMAVFIIGGLVLKDSFSPRKFFMGPKKNNIENTDKKES